MWTAPIHDPEVLKFVLNELETKKEEFGSYKRLFGLVTAMSGV